METEDCPTSNIIETVTKSKEISGAVNHSGDAPMVNGIANGIAEKIKKQRDESKEKHRDRHKDKHRDKDKHKDRGEHKHSSSSEHKSKDRHSSSSKDKVKEKHKDKDREREGHKDGKHRDEKRDKEHKSSSSSHKEKDRKDDKSSGSPSKHGSSSSKSHSSSKEKDKHSSSSREKEKDKDRSEKDKDRSEKEKDRTDKDKHRSDKEKSKHSSSDKSKHSSSKDKEKRERNKEKERERAKDTEKDQKEEKVKHGKELEKESCKRIISDGEDEPVVPAPEIKVEPESEEPLKVKTEPVDSFMCNFVASQDDSGDEGALVIKEEDDDDDVPLLERSSVKREATDDEDEMPLLARKKVKKEKVKKRKMESDEEFEEDYKPPKKKAAKKQKFKEEPMSQDSSMTLSPKKKKKQEEEQEVWKWWEEEKKPDGIKWNFLEHKGPVFAADYEPLPPNVKFFYEGQEMKLSSETEEVATFYARMLDHDYTTKEAFNTNFFKDWRKVMSPKEKEKITDLKKCNFKQMHAYFQQKSEERKAMSKEEKKVIKEKNEVLVEEYGFCLVDGHKEKIGNFKIEPPGLFRGRGEHPKMGMLKKRVNPEDVLINCSKGSKVPEPPAGHKWKEVRHDNTVTWLASWTENVQGQVKYVMLNPSSKLKGEKDWQKYETARKLAKSIDKIRKEYREDFKSKEMRIRQRAVALYFIDILALRAGNEKDEDQADTVGCCSLRTEHISLHEEKDGRQYVVVFDFLGKDSIRYYNEVPVEKRVFKNLQLFMENKKGSDDLFDRLNTTILNKHLNELMEGLTAKVFRTFNASWTLQQQLAELTKPTYTIPEMILAYNRANRAVAILCNHQRSIPKSHQKSMDNLKGKIQSKKDAVDEAEKQYKYAKKDAKSGSAKERIIADKAKKKLERLREQLQKLEVQETDREENKTIALGTSKLNYLDPRISVAWCKKYNVPIEKVYNKTQRQKFRWAIDMAGPDYVF